MTAAEGGCVGPGSRGPGGRVGLRELLGLMVMGLLVDYYYYCYVKKMKMMTSWCGFYVRVDVNLGIIIMVKKKMR